MELLEYIEKCREVKETCGWPEEEKNMALRNEILVGLKTPLGYQKGLGEHQNMLATERVIEIATDIYNSDCQKSKYSFHRSRGHTATIKWSSEAARKPTRRQGNC